MMIPGQPTKLRKASRELGVQTPNLRREGFRVLVVVIA